MITIFCLIDQMTEEIENWICEYDDDQHVIQLYTDIVASSENNLFFCLGELATQVFQAEGEKWFVTDHAELYDWCNGCYSMFFDQMIKFESDADNLFDSKVDVLGLVQYEGKLVFSAREQELLLEMCNMINNNSYETLWNYNGNLGMYFLECQSHYDMWLHICLLMIRLIESPGDDLSKVQRYLVLSLYHNLALLDKQGTRTNQFLEYALKMDFLTAEELYFIWNQVKALNFRNIIACDSNTGILLDKIYEMVYCDYTQKLDAELQSIPAQSRDDSRVMVFTIQLLGDNHAPTKSVTERCSALCSIGKEVMLVNTREQYTDQGGVPLSLKFTGNVIEEYSRINRLSVGDSQQVRLYQPKVSMPNLEEIRKIITLVKEYRPKYIMSIGTGSIVADLCEKVVPVFPMALVFSTIPTSMCTYKILGRELNEDEKDIYKNIIESRFTFRLQPQTKKLTRLQLGIPEDAFVLVVVGIRLSYEVTDEFCDMLERCLTDCMHVVFAGEFDTYDEMCDKHILLKESSSYIGFCDDILALMEIVDLYVNPKRSGGGFSVIEAFEKEKPGVYLKMGDVYTAGGEDFAVDSYEEMAKTIARYQSDTAFYKSQANLARERAKLMTDSIAAMQDLDDKIMKIVECEQ